ncbi:MAG: DUF488 family protein [Planctomycetota bacterium]
MGPTTFRIKRVYEPASDDDGVRVLVDRLWPRGVKKDAGRWSAWWKELAPSAELRRWFGHNPERFDAFARRYRAELDAAAEAAGRRLAEVGDAPVVTLLYSARDEAHNQAVVLRGWLSER